MAHQPVVMRVADQRLVHAVGQLRVGELGEAGGVEGRKGTQQPKELENDQEHSGIGGFAEPGEAWREEKVERPDARPAVAGRRQE